MQNRDLNSQVIGNIIQKLKSEDQQLQITVTCAALCQRTATATKIAKNDR